MGRIFIEEIRKVFGNARTLVFLLCLCLALLGAMYLEEHSGTVLYDGDVYKELYSDLEGLDVEQASALLLEKKSYASDHIFENGEYCSSAILDLQLYRDVSDEIENVRSYREFRENIRISANRITSGYLGVKPGTFVYRNAVKTKNDYDRVGDISLAIGPQQGWKGFFTNRYMDWLVLCFGAFCVLLLISEERDSNKMVLTGTTRYGRLDHAIIKWAVVMVSTLIVGLLLFGIGLFRYGNRFGLGSWKRPLVSLLLFRTSTFTGTIGSYLILWLLVKMLALGALLSLFYLAVIRLRTIVTQFLVAISVIVAEDVLYLVIGNQSVWVALKEWNLISFLQTECVFGIYKNTNLFGYPVSYAVGGCIFLGLLLIGSGVWAVLTYQRGMLPAKRKEWAHRLVLGRHLNVLRHEAYKLLICERVWAILFIGILLIPVITKTQGEIVSSEENLWYKKYMLQYEGPLTVEKSELITSEWGHLNETEEKRLAEYAAVTSEEESIFLDYKYQSFVVQYKAYKLVWERKCQIEAEGGYFLYDSGYQVFFGKKDQGSKNTMFLVVLGVLLILMGASVYGIEYESGLFRLIRTNSFGTARLYIRKALVAGILVTILMVGIYGTYLWRILQDYGNQGFSFPLCSITGMTQKNISVGQAIAGLLALRFLFFSALLHGTFWLTKLTKSKSVTILIEIIGFCGVVLLVRG